MSLEAYLADQRLDAELITLGRETTTAGMAAEALGVPIDIVVKSVVFQAKGGAIVVVGRSARPPKASGPSKIVIMGMSLLRLTVK